MPNTTRQKLKTIFSIRTAVSPVLSIPFHSIPFQHCHPTQTHPLPLPFSLRSLHSLRYPLLLLYLKTRSLSLSLFLFFFFFFFFFLLFDIFLSFCEIFSPLFFPLLFNSSPFPFILSPPPLPSSSLLSPLSPPLSSSSHQIVQQNIFNHLPNPSPLPSPLFFPLLGPTSFFQQKKNDESPYVSAYLYVYKLKFEIVIQSMAQSLSLF